jgi:hypothetical protein
LIKRDGKGNQSDNERSEQNKSRHDRKHSKFRKQSQDGQNADLPFTPAIAVSRRNVRLYRPIRQMIKLLFFKKLDYLLDSGRSRQVKWPDKKAARTTDSEERDPLICSIK